MQYGYSIRILEDDKDKGVRQAQVKYTKDLALRTFNERF